MTNQAMTNVVQRRIKQGTVMPARLVGLMGLMGFIGFSVEGLRV